MYFASIFYFTVAIASHFTHGLTVPDSSSVTATSTSTTSSEAPTSTDICPAYIAPDRCDISRREIGALEKRANEEYWFRFDDPSIAQDGDFLELAPRPGSKDYDDQAYKWISMDVSQVTRGRIKDRRATLYVLPTGTRDNLSSQAQDFFAARDKKQRLDYGTKENELGDIGIQGVSPNAGGVLPLDDFRNKVIRVVMKFTSTKGGKVTFKSIDGKTRSITNGATKDDQAALANFC